MAPPKKKLNLRWLKGVVAIVAMLTVAFGAHRALMWIRGLPLVAIKTIRIEKPLKRVSLPALQAATKNAVHGNFFTTDMKSVRAEFEKVPWVRSASVRRIWPDRLDITLEEHEPLARWGSDALVNTYAEVFHADYTGDLPHFVGPLGSEKEVTEAYRDFSDILMKAQLQPKEILLSPRRAWQVKLASGMVLDLGRVEMRERLTRFVAVSKQVPELQERKGRADLRYSNGFALKLTGMVLPKQATDKVQTKK